MKQEFTVVRKLKDNKGVEYGVGDTIKVKELRHKTEMQNTVNRYEGKIVSFEVDADKYNSPQRPVTVTIDTATGTKTLRVDNLELIEKV